MKARIRKDLTTAVRAWQSFWFETPALAHWQLYTRLMGGLLLLYYLGRFPDLNFTYGETGLFPEQVLQEILPASLKAYRFSLLSLSPAPALLYACYAVLLGSLLALTVGFYPALASVVAFLLHLTFANKAAYHSYGFDKAAGTFLFCMVVAGAGQPRVWLSSVGLRFMQIQVAVIYAYSGIDKLKGSTWWRGDAIWQLVSNPQQSAWDMTWLAQAPWVMALVSVSTILWETYFPVAVAVPQLRRLWLLGGVALHLGICLYMKLPFFAFLMIFSYLFFLTPEELRVLRVYSQSGWTGVSRRLHIRN